MATCEHCGTQLDDGWHPGVDASDAEDVRACRDLLAGMLEASRVQVVEERTAKRGFAERLSNLVDVGRRLAGLQPAIVSRTQQEADMWAKWYRLLNEAPAGTRKAG